MNKEHLALFTEKLTSIIKIKKKIQWLKFSFISNKMYIYVNKAK